MKTSIEYIYGLYIDDDDDYIVYCGRSDDPEGRLKKHITESNNNKCQTKKCKTLRALMAEGRVINVKILETVDISVPNSAEDLWVVNLQGKGQALLNSKAGDQERFKHIPDPEYIKVPWSAALINNADWSKDYFACKKGEQGCCIKGISLYRRGTSKMRAVHPIKGQFEILGWGWDGIVKNAVKKLSN